MNQQYSRKGNRVYNSRVDSSFSCCLFWGPFWWTIQHSLTLLRSQPKPRLRQSWLIQKWKGFAVPWAVGPAQNHSSKSLSTAVLRRIMNTPVYNLCQPLSFMYRNFAWSILDTLETRWPRCVIQLDQQNHSLKSVSTAVWQRIVNRAGPQYTIFVNIFLLCLGNFAWNILDTLETRWPRCVLTLN